MEDELGLELSVEQLTRGLLRPSVHLEDKGVDLGNGELASTNHIGRNAGDVLSIFQFKPSSNMA